MTKQAPIRADRSRQKEVCACVGIMDGSTGVTQWHPDTTGAPYREILTVLPQQWLMIGAYLAQQCDFADNMITTDSSISTLLWSIEGR
jgi:hypothetical protein